MRTILALFVFSWAGTAFGWPAQYYSAGQKTNPNADVVLATSGVLASPGTLGANYQVSMMLNASTALTYKLETLNEAATLVNTIYMSTPGNQITVVNPQANFYIPDGYTIRIVTGGALVLGNTAQASLILEPKELN
jgi:hypothetical protein